MLDDKDNDGELGEQDDVRADVDGVTGAGNDTIVDLVGAANGFDGGPGYDMIVGGDGWDATLIGGAGNDTVYGADGNDMLWGNAGDDFLHGGAAADFIDGGPDQDTINSKDGSKDSVSCGIGIDRITADVLDDLFGCERKG